MSDSKTFQRTESASEIAPERVDPAHRSLGNQPHVQFGPPRPGTPSSGTQGLGSADPAVPGPVAPAAAGGRSGPKWGARATGASSSGEDRSLPTKLQAKMDRLLADLAALEEPESDVLPLPFRHESSDFRPSEESRELSEGDGQNHQDRLETCETLGDSQPHRVESEPSTAFPVGLAELSVYSAGDEESDATDRTPVNEDLASLHGVAFEGDLGGEGPARAEESLGNGGNLNMTGSLGVASDLQIELVLSNAGLGQPNEGSLASVVRLGAAVTLEEAANVSGADPALMADASGAFSRQAREILDILKRRQEQLSYQKNELELREAALEKQMRQERLALVERQRQLQELEAQAPSSARESASSFANWPTAELGVEAKTGTSAGPRGGVSTDASVELPAAVTEGRGERRITPEWIAANERLAYGVWDESLSVAGQGGTAELVDGCDEHQDANFYAVIEEYVHRQVQQEQVAASLVSVPASRLSPSGAAASSAVSRAVREATSSSGDNASGLQRQAQQLRQQHETAIRAMQQTRRQLELLKDILVQQQQHWAVEVDRLASEQHEWQETRAWQQQQWTVGMEEIERLRVIEQHESAKRATFLDQREAAIQAMEERLQQAQVEVLRDRVVLKQLERTVRQTLSNADWNQRWQIISEETQGYLKKVHQDAETLQAAAKRKLERLESRQSEMLLYRESLRNWIERQMKLVSRRVAHGEDRQQSLQAQWEAVQLARQELRSQQAVLNEWLTAGLQAVDQRLQPSPPQRAGQDAA